MTRSGLEKLQSKDIQLVYGSLALSSELRGSFKMLVVGT